jgi:hypothetical protein
LRAARVSIPDSSNATYYVFLLLHKTPDISYDEYREVRRGLLLAYCAATKVVYPRALNIVGITTETGLDERRSEDVVYLDVSDWTSEMQEEAVRTREKLNLLKEVKLRRTNVSGCRGSRTTGPGDTSPPSGMRGRDRNSPCPCGSGKKFKKCCGGN